MNVDIGMNALQLLFKITENNPSIDAVTLAVYKPTLGFKERIAKNNPLLAYKLDTGMSSDVPKEIYWNPSLNLNEQSIVVKELMYHDSSDEFNRRTKLNIKNFTNEEMNRIISNLSKEQTLAICSVCDMADGKIAHIPMMDFACEISVNNLNLIKRIIKLMELKGAILESGKSYHFYGFHLISPERWLDLMAKFLLAAPLTDLRYVAHRILGKTCVLRITPTLLKPTEPTVKAIIN